MQTHPNRWNRPACYAEDWTKACIECKEVKGIDGYWWHKRHGNLRPLSLCKVCDNRRNLERRRQKTIELRNAEEWVPFAAVQEQLAMLLHERGRDFVCEYVIRRSSRTLQRLRPDSLIQFTQAERILIESGQEDRVMDLPVVIDPTRKRPSKAA